MTPRQAALAAGAIYYFTGKACPAGHVANRFVSTRTCSACANEKGPLWKAANKDALVLYEKQRYAAQPEFYRNKAAKHRKENPTAFLAAQEKYRNTAKCKSTRTAWAQNNPDKTYAKYKKWYENGGKAISRAHVKARHAAKRTRTPPWADRAAIVSFYMNAPAGMSVDHIIPLRGKLVSGLHVLENLQYLSCSENSRKSNKYEVQL